MAIYRGTGGAGDATNDITINRVTELTQEAEASATAAASSATSAASSASSASSSATSAANSATSSASSATAAATSATSAATSATAASTAKTGAETAETNAEAAQGYAEEWATKAEDSLISTDAGGDGSTDYSALHHAAKAASSATAASTSASAASTSATASASSATASASSASDASDSASAAATSATAAASSATSASSSATAASNAQSAAESARDSALAAYDSFDDRYLGAKASDPVLDNDGNALVAGALYFNTTDELMKLYTGSAWVLAYVSVGNLDTDDLSEGSTNLYYTDTRVGTYLTNNNYLTQTAGDARYDALGTAVALSIALG